MVRDISAPGLQQLGVPSRIEAVFAPQCLRLFLHAACRIWGTGWQPAMVQVPSTSPNPWLRWLIHRVQAPECDSAIDPKIHHRYSVRDSVFGYLDPLGNSTCSICGPHPPRGLLHPQLRVVESIHCPSAVLACHLEPNDP